MPGRLRDDEHALDQERSARSSRTERGGNPAHPRDSGCIQGSWNARDQKGTRLARQDADQLFHRAEYANEDVIRAGSLSAERRRHQYFGFDFESDKRRDAKGHGQEPAGPSRGHSGPASRLGRLRLLPGATTEDQRHQRRGRRARAPDAGAARPLHHPRTRKPTWRICMWSLSATFFSAELRARIFLA